MKFTTLYKFINSSGYKKKKREKTEQKQRGRYMSAVASNRGPNLEVNKFAQSQYPQAIDQGGRGQTNNDGPREPTDKGRYGLLVHQLSLNPTTSTYYLHHSSYQGAALPQMEKSKKINNKLVEPISSMFWAMGQSLWVIPQLLPPHQVTESIM